MSQPDFSHVTFISAGAGSGKTYRLTQELQAALASDRITPAGILGTTFTVKAAAELQQRVRSRLIENGDLQLAEQMSQALIGTVHSVCERLLKRFAFDLGLSPELAPISIEDGQRLFRQALDEVLTGAEVGQMNATAWRLNQGDWASDVMAIATKARENNLTAQALPAMAATSARTLLAHFDPAHATNPDRALQDALQQALTNLDVALDSTKVTRTYQRQMQQALLQLQQQQMPWKTWLDLAVNGPGKKSREVVAEVHRIANSYAGHPQLHADLRTYIESTMTIAGKALARFQALKTERGLIDFVDMEQLTLQALSLPDIAHRLQEELQLLMVDEFQDTSPIQVALFIKLAELADRAIFVGDVKQAIYAFRGCDPDLVFSTLAGMSAAAATTDILDLNWRSQPALVEFVNTTFTDAFATDGLRRAQVALQPARDATLPGPAVLHWTLAGSAAERAVGIATQVSAMVSAQTPVTDPESGAVRPVSWGDIAILASTNAHVESIARTLADSNVPMKMTLSGLLATPEVALAKACIRRMNDPSDTLATAEIITLSESRLPEDWLAERLDWVASEADNYRWAESTHPLIARLAVLRERCALQSPLESVASVLNDIGARAIVTRWGPDAVKAAQRQRNLDAFLNLVVQYEEHCASHHDAATLTGLLFWLDHPTSAELDLQPMVTSGDAVQIITYHRAKGLEWPVVVVTDFDVNERPSVFDTRIHLEAAFDVRDPLANRSIRLWPNVFGDKTKNLAVRDRILASDEGQQCEHLSAAERRRLAYVGITRARDMLVVALPDKKPRDNAWLYHFNQGLLLPKAVPVPAGAVQPVPQPFTPRWFVWRPHRDERVKESLVPSSVAPLTSSSIDSTVDLGQRIPIHGDDITALGNALHAIIAAECVNADMSDAVERAADILQAHNVQTTIQADDAVSAARRLLGHLRTTYAPESVLTECPVQWLMPDGRVVRGFIDLLIDTGDELLVIDHKSSPQPRSHWGAEVEAYSGQLQTYAAAVTQATGRPTRVLLHFPISAGLVKVNL